ncbi:hypothetical protein F7725_004927 [Dissostichus mawsoni]|uniref:Uncharacterized protein n=1 Tax=Dissostichus mawsoni TaxID=36200 RepID=A0A7J5XKV5_DISMA|nr:hypothetical protein F7725_004927 [Dissostichus mawsoni]
MATMVKKALRFDWSTIVLSPPCSPGPGRIRTQRTARLKKETTIKVKIINPRSKTNIQVGDGMHDSQVTLHTGQDVKTIRRGALLTPSLETQVEDEDAEREEEEDEDRYRVSSH